MRINYIIFIFLDYHTLLYTYIASNTEEVINIMKKYKNYDIKYINLRTNKNKKIYDYIKE